MTPPADPPHGRGTLRLVETVTALPAADGLRLLHGVDVLRVRGPVTALTAALKRLVEGVPAAELATLAPGSVLRVLAARLAEAGWITDADPAHGRGTAAERQIGYLTLFGPDAPAMQSRIAASRVAVLGVGGVGGVVAQHLAGAGVGALWLVDHDRVAAHNLNRQFLFGPADVGASKTDACARALANLAPAAQLHTVERLVASPEDLGDLPDRLDLLVLAADTPLDIAAIVWDWARPRSVPVCSAAVGLDTGYWGPLLVPRLGHCARCFESQRVARLSAEDAEVALIGGPPTPYSFGPTNTVVSALLAHEVLRFLATGRCALLNRRGHLRFTDSSTSFLEGGPCGCDTASPRTAHSRTTMAAPHGAPSER
ncbi:ThiF family adenylyltransferase [Streptomyces sp. NPDC048111]|uniref:ThiF family adenylyltransferase n=1 Tax=Streptomyces sp. NPDC048111 TaxID=3365500 RepID=UPI0037195168